MRLRVRLRCAYYYHIDSKSAMLNKGFKLLLFLPRLIRCHPIEWLNHAGYSPIIGASNVDLRAFSA